MAPSLSSRLSDVHPKMLRGEREGDHKKLAVGQSVERALEIAGIQKQDAAGRMGYSDQGTVSRWCSGLERPHFDKLFELDGFEVAWMKARAERNQRIKARTVFEIDEAKSA